MSVIELDGAAGEGGGQILRTALALSLVTGAPFRIDGIRANREKPGLLRQHLTAVLAAQRIGRAEVRGAELGSRSLTFAPRGIEGGELHFAVGTAGSTTLVLQTILPALLAAGSPSDVRLEGGTHNPSAPPFDFIEGAFLPLLARIGGHVEARLWRHGFFPAGGGEIRLGIAPSALRPIELLDRGAIRSVRATALVANLGREIGRREVEVVARELQLAPDDVSVEQVRGSAGPGNVVVVRVETDASTEVFTAFGERGRTAESVATEVARDARTFIESGVPVGEHLADQLMLPLALAGGGVFRTVEPSSHARTNAAVIERFLDRRIAFDRDGATWLVSVSR